MEGSCLMLHVQCGESGENIPREFSRREIKAVKNCIQIIENLIMEQKPEQTETYRMMGEALLRIEKFYGLRPFGNVR